MILTKKFKLERNHVIEINSDIWNICIIRFGALAGTMPPLPTDTTMVITWIGKGPVSVSQGGVTQFKQYCFSKGLSP